MCFIARCIFGLIFCWTAFETFLKIFGKSLHNLWNLWHIFERSLTNLAKSLRISEHLLNIFEISLEHLWNIFETSLKSSLKNVWTSLNNLWKYFNNLWQIFDHLWTISENLWQLPGIPLNNLRKQVSKSCQSAPLKQCSSATSTFGIWYMKHVGRVGWGGGTFALQVQVNVEDSPDW